MATIPEQLQAVLHDVEAVLEENKRLNAALAKANAEVFSLMTKKSLIDDVKKDVATFHQRTHDAGLQCMTFDKKNGTLEDDVKRFLGLAPYQNDKAKNDGKFVAKLDKAYGAAQVDAMIQRLRGVG